MREPFRLDHGIIPAVSSCLYYIIEIAGNESELQFGELVGQALMVRSRSRSGRFAFDACVDEERVNGWELLADRKVGQPAALPSVSIS